MKTMLHTKRILSWFDCVPLRPEQDSLRSFTTEKPILNSLDKAVKLHAVKCSAVSFISLQSTLVLIPRAAQHTPQPP